MSDAPAAEEPPAMPAVGEVEQLSPNVRRLTQNNPSVFTAVGTNTHLIGNRRLWVLDPGPENEAHFESLVAAIGDAVVLGVISSHSHRDHWPLAPRLAAHFDAPTLGMQTLGGYEPLRHIADGEILEDGGPLLEAIHTPGHAEDHLCFLFSAERALFSGDHIMGWSTSVIAPPGGHLNDYMASLAKLESYAFDRMYPAHGLPIEDPRQRIDELTRHRQARTAQALEALQSGLTDIPSMVDRIYEGLDPRLHTPAQWSLLAHLLALIEDDRVEIIEENEDPLKARYSVT
jgi:glyoxylase-like metal-dependent hydrolase (beta-lactamase superfamily II)